MMQEKIHSKIKEALIELGAPGAAFVVERPSAMEHGDYATNAALAAAKALKQNPKKVAEGIAAHLKDTIDGVEKIEIAGAGFINFFLSREAVIEEVLKAANDERWGKSECYLDQTVMVEYTDPNPFKEFHIGHLMSNAIGEAIARVLEASGAEVLRANYQGDVGPHVAKGIFGLQKMGITDPSVSDLSKAYVEGARLYEESAADKAAIDALNKKIYEKSDNAVNDLYEKGRKLSLEHFGELYKMLGTKFNFYFFESETGPLGLEMVREHPEVFELSDGALVFKGEPYGLHTRVFVTSQGIPTYEAKDLGLIKLKEEKASADESITITANEQNEYFKVVIEAAKHIPELKEFAGITKHISHGMMRFAQGKMSSRTGNVVTGESLLMDLSLAAKEKMQGRKVADVEKIAQQVAVGAIKYQVLKQGSGKDIIFDPEKSLSMEGDSGPYLQYAHTRALSLIEAAQKEGIEAAADEVPQNAGALERLLMHYPDVVEHAAGEFEPHYVTTYLTELAAAFNSWYASERVIGGKHPAYGLLLAKAVEQTLSKGFQVLGIPAPEEM